MFFGIGFSVYLLFNAYVYVRLLRLLNSKRQKSLFTVVYLLLASSFPATEFLSHSDVPSWLNPVLFYGYLSLPYLLYLFLLLLLHDILQGINRISKLLPVQTLRSGRARALTLALLLLLPAIAVMAGTFRNTNLKVNEFRVGVPRRSSAMNILTIAVASDFHLREFTDLGLIRAFADQVNALNVDLVLIPGDILEGDRQNGRVDEFAREFRRIRSRYGLFGSPGNHESHGRDHALAFFKNSGIIMLQDSVVCIDGAFSLIGRKDSRSQGRKPIGELANTVPDSLPILVLDHKPTDLENIAASGADVVVCGHTHNGQLWPLNLVVDRIYDVSWGYRQIRTLHAFVTSGVQVWGPPVRTAGDSEIMLITATLK